MPYKDPAKKAEYDRKRQVAKGTELKAYRRIYYEANRERIAVWQKEHQANNRDKYREYKLQRNYGISLEEFDLMVTAQGDRCACCGTSEPGGSKETWNVDHDHSTGKVRGLLCTNCNHGIGKLGDSIEGLEQALRYLKQSQ